MSLRLSDLVDAARQTTERQRRRVPEGELRRRAEEVAAAVQAGRMRRALDAPGVAVIAEVKGASPLSGPLVEEFDPDGLARTYAEHGAAAVSVLTEERFFAGSIEILERISAGIDLPTLRKDFVVEPYGVWRAATAGAAAVLLIAEVLEGNALAEFVEMAHSVNLDALVEFHRPSLLDRAADAGSGLIGVNNRDLDTLEIRPRHCDAVVADLPADAVRVAESAISGPDDVARVRDAGYQAVLVGTALVTSEDPGATLAGLVAAGDGGAGTRAPEEGASPSSVEEVLDAFSDLPILGVEGTDDGAER